MPDLDKRDPIHGGFKGTCSSCPFNEGMNEDGTMTQNLGCLPSAGDVLQLKRTTGDNWACHTDDSKVCTGLCLHAKEYDLDMSKGQLIHEPGVHSSARPQTNQDIQ